MQEYARVPGEDAFTQARECYGELEEWLPARPPGCSMPSWKTGWTYGAGSCCGGCSRGTWTCWP